MPQQHFNIRDYVTFNEQGRAICPSCQQIKGGNYRKPNLSILESGAYKCHRGCTSEEIRAALGAEKQRIVPSALAAPKPLPNVTVSPQQKMEAHNRLLESDGSAKQWLYQRGITNEIIRWFHLGIVRAKVGKKPFRHVNAISIPIPSNSDETAYFQKKRVLPWMTEAQLIDELGDLYKEFKPWSQYGIPAMVWFTHKPANATSTWLCEGEWDAMLLGWQCFRQDLPIAVATFTCGCGNVPPQQELEKLPGNVYVFYDRNDEPDKKGDRPGDVGAKKVCRELGDRGRLALVPMPDDCQVKGWDVTNALLHGFTLADFVGAAHEAMELKFEEEDKQNPLRSRLVSTDELVARAPEFVEWLVPDLLTCDELFALGSPPRGGKSLMCMLLSKCIATGQNFLDRPVTKGSVIYVNLEDSEAKVRERVEAQQWAEGLPVYWIDRFKLPEIPYLIELADGMDDLRLIILDTLSRVRTDETSESSAEMSMVLEPLQEFAKSRKVCVLLVHHTRKLKVDGDTLEDLFDSLRGSGAIRGTARGLWIIAPGDNCYRLAVENGWGKYDLKIRLNPERLEWQLLGKWNPIVNLDQKQQVLDYLNKVGSATIDVIAEETAIPKRSLYTVLDRLCQENLLEKVGSRKSAVYQRPIQPIQLLNSLLNSSNEDGESDTGAIQQKNNIFSIGDHPKPDHDCNCNDDQVLPNDHLFRESTFVELGDQNAEKVEGESVTAIQQQFNSNSTVELEIGDKVEILVGQFAGKPCFIEALGDEGKLRVKAKGWRVTQQYLPVELRLLNRRGE